MAKILLACFLAFCTNINAQKIRFTDTTNVWTIQYEDELGYIHNSYDKYTGDSFFNGYLYHKLDEYFSYWVREDTVLNRVYAISTIPDGNHPDTFEHLIYDYNLSVGDTFWATGIMDTIGYLVDNVGTVIINGVAHKTMQLDAVVNGGFTPPFSVIEGIGCLTSPIFTFYPRAEFPPHVICFRHQGTYPEVSPRIEWLDNVSSCTLKAEHLSLPKKQIIIAPNPVCSGTKVLLPEEIANGSYSIYSYSGSLIFHETISNAHSFELTITLSPGIYFLNVQDFTHQEQFYTTFLSE